LIPEDIPKKMEEARIFFGTLEYNRAVGDEDDPAVLVERGEDHQLEKLDLKLDDGWKLQKFEKPAPLTV
jgi:hypothetical protein